MKKSISICFKHVMVLLFAIATVNINLSHAATSPVTSTATEVKSAEPTAMQRWAMRVMTRKVEKQKEKIERQKAKIEKWQKEGKYEKVAKAKKAMSRNLRLGLILGIIGLILLLFPVVWIIGLILFVIGLVLILIELLQM